MRFITLLLSINLIGLVAPATRSLAQEIRIEAESGQLNGFSLFMGGTFIEADVANPTATYTFSGTDGTYDIIARYCDEDDGNSSYELIGSVAGVFAAWNGDQPTGSTTCSTEARLVRKVAKAVELNNGETITFACLRDPGEPCRVDYFEFVCASQAPIPQTFLQRAFPGAMGFGSSTSGARGQDAEVCAVTSLLDSGPGSFRACAEQCVPAYITFETSGYIDLSEQVDITGNKTIECATAPGDGVVFRKSRLRVFGNNVILRGCRAWPGSEPGGQPLNVRDSIFVGSDNATVHGAIVANNSMMFATDEVTGTWNPVENVTFQHNIVAWSLNTESLNSHGMLIGHDATRVSILENYIAFNDFRNPRVAAVVDPVEIVNNLIYCHYHDAMDIDNGTTSTHIIGNRLKGRVDTQSEDCTNTDSRYIEIKEDSVAYLSDNTLSGGAPATVHVDGTSEVAPNPLFSSHVTVMPVPSGEVEGRVFGNAGPANLMILEVDAFGHYASGTGGLIVHPDDVGGYPVLQGGTIPSDTDGDGMPDAWEQQHCGGSCAPTDDHDNDGYENIEEWFHSFYSVM